MHYETHLCYTLIYVHAHFPTQITRQLGAGIGATITHPGITVCCVVELFLHVVRAQLHVVRALFFSQSTNTQSHIELDPSARRLAINIEYDEKAGSAPAASAGAAKGMVLDRVSICCVLNSLLPCAFFRFVVSP